MTGRGPYASGIAARERLLRAAASAAADPHGRLDLASLAAAAGLTAGGVMHHFPSRDAILVAAATEQGMIGGPEERTALTLELVRIACDRTSRAQTAARSALQYWANTQQRDAARQIGVMLLNALTIPRLPAVDGRAENGE